MSTLLKKQPLELLLMLLALSLSACIEDNPDFNPELFSDASGGGLISAGTGSVGGDPIGGDPVGGDPVGGDPVGGDPVGGDPVGGDPVGGDPVGGDPVGGDPVGGDPVGGTPVGGDPVGGDPVGGEPVGGDPVGGTPVGGTPVGGTPVGGMFSVVDQDQDGSPEGEDCDDLNPNRAPGLEERCDGIDNNCNGQVDELYPEVGQRCETGVGACQVTARFECAGDGLGVRCPASPLSPAEELCDELDNDCDGQVDEQGVCDQTCLPSPEICDELDNDCDGQVDEGLPQQCACGQAEACNGADDDCDGQVDEDLPELCIVEIAQSNEGRQGSYLGAVLLAAGDVNGDGIEDVIASAPGGDLSRLQDINSDTNGAVYIINGQTGETVSTFLGQGAFGASLAWGDFNGDGQAELAVGAPRHQSNGRAQGSVFIISPNGVTITTVNFQRNEAATGLGVALLSQPQPNGVATRLIFGEPFYTDADGRVGRLRAQSFVNGWNNPTNHISLAGGVGVGRLGERLHAIPDFNGDGVDELITTFTDNNNQRSTWLYNASNDISSTSLSPNNAGRLFGQSFIWGQFSVFGAESYAVSDPSAFDGDGVVYWYDPTSFNSLSEITRGSSNERGFGAALTTVPRSPRDVLFVGSQDSSNVRAITRGFPTSTLEATIQRDDDGFGAALTASRTPNPDGTYRLFIGSPQESSDRGLVRVFSVR